MPIIETYKQFSIWYNEQVNLYLALKDNEIVFFSDSLDKLKQLIDASILPKKR